MSKVRIVKWSLKRKAPEVDSMINREIVDTAAERTAGKILDDIRSNGAAAVVKYTRKFDKAQLTEKDLCLPEAQLKNCDSQVDGAFKSAAMEAHRRIVSFARKGMKADWREKGPDGEVVGEQMSAYERVGVYVPGGTAPLASTALMTVTLAVVAGVKEVVVCTPCDSKGKVDPHIVFALKLAGATEIYRVGGVQAIGLMAFGAGDIKKVQKIVGPGNAYVTAAKRSVYGYVALDLVAGPSEIAILADKKASAANIAADLLSQAEHGTGREKALLVTDSNNLAIRVKKEIEKQRVRLSRKIAVDKVISNGMLIVVVNNIKEGMELCNRFAPEHFEIHVSNPSKWLKKVRTAGAVFLGNWTPEAVGDFIAGPSHVLPTGGAASMFSGLTVDDFRLRTSFMKYTRGALRNARGHLETFARVEGLDAHGRSVSIRFENDDV